jgi:hypothetical protein
MANYRQLHSRIWSDTWFIELKPEYKLLFIYLFGNERSSVCGLYEIPIRIISFETGLDRSVIQNAFEVFIKADKIKYDFETSVIWVKNMLHYQGSSSDLLHRRIKADFKTVPECELKNEFLYWLRNTVSIPYAYAIYTMLSVSVSKSVSVSEGEGVGEGETNWIPETPKQAQAHPDIQAFHEICSRTPGQRDYGLVIETIQLLRAQHGDQLVDKVKPFWLAWSGRRNKQTGKPYDPTSLVWLTEWAVNNEIPPVNGTQPAAAPAINEKAVETTKQMVDKKWSFQPAPPPDARPKIKQLAKQKGIRK